MLSLNLVLGKYELTHLIKSSFVRGACSTTNVTIMNVESNKVNEFQILLSELKISIDKLKSESKDKYNKIKGSTEDEYELAYARGYYFGQLASLEDCVNLFGILLKSIQKNNKITVDILKQQITVMIKVIEDLSFKVKANEPITEFVDSIQNVVLLVKTNISNLR